MAGKQIYADKVSYRPRLSWAVRSGFNLDDVEAPGLRETAGGLQVGSHRTAQNRPFGRSDRMETGNERVSPAGLDLDKDQSRAIAQHEIDFLAPISRVTPVLRDPLHAPLPHQPVGGALLRQKALGSRPGPGSPTREPTIPHLAPKLMQHADGVRPRAGFDN